MQLLGKVSGADPRRGERRAGAGGELAREPCGRLLRDERGPARSAQPGHGRGRPDRLRLAAVELGGARGAGREAQGRASAGRLSAGAVEAFDRRTPSHQCGTARMGTRPGDERRRHLLPGARPTSEPFVVDASFLPTSAAVNPALTIAAQALRSADHIIKGPAAWAPRRASTSYRRRRLAGWSRLLAAALSEDPASAGVICFEAGGRILGPFYHLPAGFAKMTKGIGRWGWQTVPQRHMHGHGDPLHPGEGHRRRFGDQRADLYAGGTRSTTTDGGRWAATAGPTRTCCPTSARPRTTTPRRTAVTARAARWASRSRGRRCRSARPTSPRRQSSASRATTT